jgi:O-acetyl-ADP-ribose deacetylase (regulator of RNase III)
MLIYVTSNIFDSPAQVLVNPVNTVGVMGKGLAYDFKIIYPEMFERYKELCNEGLFEVGKLWLYKTPNKWVLNFPTKKHWRSKSRVEWIEAGLKKFADTYVDKRITSISFPLLGCGNGQLDWESQVKPMMERYLSPLPISVYIHEVHKTVVPEHHDLQAFKAWLHREPESLPFTEFWDDLREVITQQDSYELDYGGYARLSHYPDMITVTIHETTYELPVDDGEGAGWYALWTELSTAGSLTPTGVSFNFGGAWDVISRLLESLDYIRRETYLYTNGTQGEMLTLIQHKARPATPAPREIIQFETAGNAES